MDKNISFIKFNLDGLKKLKNNPEEQTKIEQYKTTNGPMSEEGGGRLFADESKDNAPVLDMDTKITTCADIPSEGGGPMMRDDTKITTCADIPSEGGGPMMRDDAKITTCAEIPSEGGGKFNPISIEDPVETTMAMGEEGGTAVTTSLGESGDFMGTTDALGEEGGDFMGSTDALGEEGGDSMGSTLALGEEGGYTTMAMGEEGGTAVTDSLGESGETTTAMGEEGGYTTMAMGEEGGSYNPMPIENPKSTPITQPKTRLNDLFTQIFKRIFSDNSFFSRFFNFFN